MPDYVLKIIAKPAEVEAPAIITERLVWAKNKAQAIAYIVGDTVVCDLASTDEIVRLTKLGIEVETAA